MRYRRIPGRQGLAPVQPDPSLGYAENFFHMCFGALPSPEAVRCFEVSLILYAEHSFNASTFTARVVTSPSPTSTAP